MTNRASDQGLLKSTLKGLREGTEGIIETVADKGYVDRDDMINCLKEGIIPHVILEDGKDGYNLEVPYEGTKEINTKSLEPEDLRGSLQAGIVPDAYKEVISDIAIHEVRKRVYEEDTNERSIYRSKEEMIERAKEGYFVRDIERNLVYCPVGEILNQKSVMKNGTVRYANKLACRRCPNRKKCFRNKSDFKEVYFSKKGLEKPCKEWLEAEGKTIEEKGIEKSKYRLKQVKVVRFFLRPDRNKMNQRKCLSEHPFGTIKRALGFGYFVMKGIRKVTGEFALMCLGYNIKRTLKLLGYNKMMELMQTG